MPTRNENSASTWRQTQLSHMDHRKIDEICDTPIATAESILKYSINPTPLLRGTAAHVLIQAMGSVAGHKGAPMRKMHNLLKRLIDTEVPLHYAPLEYGPEEELADLTHWVLRETPFMRPPEAAYFARRQIKLIHNFYGGMPPQKLKRAYKTLASLDPTYREPPNLHAQFIEHKTLTQQLTPTPEENYRRALQLLNMPPKGNA